MKIKSIFFLLIAITMSSCKQFYDYNANYDGDKLVVNGTIEANVGVSVALSKTQSPSGLIQNEGFNVKNGRVWLYQNDTLVAEMTLDNKGKYMIDKLKPQAGKAYRLKAVAENLDTVESLPVIMPEVPIINSFILKKDNAYAINQGRSAAFFSVDVKDDVKEKNFYLLDSYVQIRTDSLYRGFLKGVAKDYEACEFDANGNIVSFTDKCFNGNNFTVEYSTEHLNKGTLRVQLSGIDKNFFNYLNNHEQPTGLELGFAEPKLIVTNMKNGYGIFAAKNTQTFTLKLD
jgi:Domain of unknown function (DUF4249)